MFKLILTVVLSFVFAAAEDVEAAEDERFPPLDAEEDEDDDVDFILASSASKAGARLLTTASRSDSFDRD